MLLIGYSYGLIPILVAAVLKACGNVGGQISLQTACVKKVDACRIGIATSTYYIGSDLGKWIWTNFSRENCGRKRLQGDVFGHGISVYDWYDSFSAYIYGK